MAYLKSDEQGFLTGNRLKASELIDEFKAMQKSLRAIERSVGGIMALLRGKTESPAPTQATQTAKAATPRARREKPQRVDVRVKVEQKTAEKTAEVKKSGETAKTEKKTETAPRKKPAVTPKTAERGEEKPKKAADKSPQTAEKKNDAASKTTAGTAPAVQPAPKKAAVPSRTAKPRQAAIPTFAASENLFIKAIEDEAGNLVAEFGMAGTIAAKSLDEAVSKFIDQYGLNDIGDEGLAYLKTIFKQEGEGKYRYEDKIEDEETYKTFRLRELPTRDERGRFISDKTREKAVEAEIAKAKQELGISDAVPEGEAESVGNPFFSAAKSLLEDRFASKVGEAVAEGTSDVAEADPAVMAMQEAVTPFVRGYKLFSDAFGRDDQEGWLKKIYNLAKRKFRTDKAYAEANKKANDSLVRESKKQSRFAALKDRISAVGSSIGDTIGNVVSIVSAAVGGMITKMGGIGGMLGAAAKKVPVLGSIFSLGKGIFDVTKIENDESLTRREKDTKGGKAAVGSIGATGGLLAGAKAGALAGSLFGPIGTAIGTIVGGAAGGFFGGKAGEILGETVGGWVSDLREFDIGGKIVSGWNSVTDSVKKSWDSAMGGISDFWDKATKTASIQLDGINSWIKEKAGIDVGGAITAATESVKGMWGATKEFFGVKPDTESGIVQKTTEEADNGQWTLGQTSAKFESGGRGAGTISNGYGDWGGKSYGTYQIAGNTGTLSAFLNQTEYGKNFSGKQIGSKAFDDEWKRLAKEDPEFAKAQHDFVKRTHYEKAMQGLAESGIDLSKRGSAVQDAIWSTSVQFGAGTAKSKAGAVPMVKAALAGRDASTMTDEEIITAIQDYKIANNRKLFARSSEAVKNGTAKRAVLEKEALLKRIEEEKASQANAPQTAADAVLAKNGLGGKPAPATGGLSILGNKEEAPKTEAKTAPVGKGPRIDALQAKRAEEADIVAKSVENVTEEMAQEASKVDTRGAGSYRTYYQDYTGKKSDIGGASINGYRTDLLNVSPLTTWGDDGGEPVYGPRAARNPAGRYFINDKRVYGEEAAKVKDMSDAMHQDIDAEFYRRIRPTTSKPAGTKNVSIGGSVGKETAPSAVKAQEAYVRVPKVPTVSKPAPAPKPVQTPPAPINGGDTKVSATVRVGGDVGQDVKDRGVAHIATGGLSQPSW